MTSPYHHSLFKRILDIFFSVLILPVAIPVLVLSMVLVSVTAGFPVFFMQTRVGWNEKHFKLIKIRSLRNKFDAKPGAAHNHNDITKVGRWLRKTRVDEIPQIWNILMGDMSWVGPRPEVPYYYEHYKNIEPTYAQRQWVRPGITGLAQLNNPNASPHENLEKLTFDLDYVRTATLWTDIRILVQSFLFVWK